MHILYIHMCIHVYGGLPRSLFPSRSSFNLVPPCAPRDPAQGGINLVRTPVSAQDTLDLVRTPVPGPCAPPCAPPCASLCVTLCATLPRAQGCLTLCATRPPAQRWLTLCATQRAGTRPAQLSPRNLANHHVHIYTHTHINYNFFSACCLGIERFHVCVCVYDICIYRGERLLCFSSSFCFVPVSRMCMFLTCSPSLSSICLSIGLRTLPIHPSLLLKCFVNHSIGLQALLQYSFRYW